MKTYKTINKPRSVKNQWISAKTMKSLYEVPVIPNNLRHQETIVQIADALNYINLVFDDILLRVNTRITESEKYVSGLQERINEVSQKVERLTHTKKAIQIYSNTKYPGSQCNKPYKSVFGDNGTEVKLVRTKVEYKEAQVVENPQNLLQFYHVKAKDKESTDYRSTMEGLGRSPKNANLINELLLFNTYKNLYKSYEMSDPFNLNATTSSKYVDDSNRQGPDDAPHSMTQRLSSARESKENYFYSPNLGDVPSIDVPLDLPDLPGIADDLRYLMELGPGIAPSVTTTPIMPELPPVDLQLPSDPQVPPELPEGKIETPELSAPLPEIPTEVEVVSAPVVKHVELPPVPEIEPEPPKKLEEKKMAPVLDDSRANLMEAIRQAGMKKLHSVEQSEKENPKKNSGANIGNDLMADLHHKLALRRKGISGIRSNDGSEVNSALTRVSAMIPPPMPTVTDKESTATEDEENDWDE